jgi:membrane glycosyltransferase
MTDSQSQPKLFLEQDMTPAGLQRLRTLFYRRIFVAAANGITLFLLAFAFARALGLGGATWPVLETLVWLCLVFSLPWTVIGFWNAVIGLWLLHGRRDGMAAAAPYWHASEVETPLKLRVAVFMTLRNEDPARAVARLKIIRDSLDRTGEGAAFDYFLLSDTSNADVAEKEAELAAAWQAYYGGDARLTYRRREHNAGFKAGNVKDFLNRWGSRYDLMLPLDADSLMTGGLIVKLARVMQANPRLGILQSLVVGTPSSSAFARIFQFGMRHGMRSYTMGSAWWSADCGPYWGHNAMVRVKPFADNCDLPLLPGKPPLGGPILSHDQIEAVLMRKADFEVRVVPVEGGSYEDNPPTVLDFTKRDLRWCQGNLQYLKLMGMPGLYPLSRFQIILAIIMYLCSTAWMAGLIFASAAFMTGGFAGAEAGSMLTFFIVFFSMNAAPKLAGLADVLLTPGGRAQYGGTFRLIGGALLELAFSFVLSAISLLRISFFVLTLPFGAAVSWGSQRRDAYGVGWADAAKALWPQTLTGLAMMATAAWFSSAVLLWTVVFWGGFVLAIPFAVITASPKLGTWMARHRICAIPEEFTRPLELAEAGRAGSGLFGAASAMEGSANNAQKAA